MAKILAVPISFFFADLQSDGAELSIEDKTWREQLQRPETIELIRLFYAISNPEIRRQFLEMAKSVAEGGARSRADEAFVSSAFARIAAIFGPHGGGGSHGGAGRPSWLRYCNVTFSPGRISQWADRMAARLAAR